ncbi:putative gamma-glutamylcyclotransferase [Tripterygium wilfordii]|uniref:Gamma-glutamylcyclotransferase family protein n=1 Tax=Tripterygium wilfordii TaxID=458696 RepID=A0A7J7DS73_TRIWF|nr:putative gamma-glutamylcyclotransferase At3g02910 [Tripterygium wilfordii]KAF5749252.1 putative gamma-glutamylcyclotransferase [Tripterygium wilfordii]
MGIENGGSESEDATTTTKAQTHLVFTYGTLKRGFWNHTLLQDLMRTGDAVFKGTYRTVEKYPLVCGPYKVPFLLNFPGVPGSRTVSGELYAVSARGFSRLDELEGTTRGHYERLPIEVRPTGNNDDGENCGNESVWVEAYYAHRSYAAEIWRRNGKRGLGEYSEKEAKGYVKRKDRPQHLSFLDQIHVFVTSSSAV